MIRKATIRDAKRCIEIAKDEGETPFTEKSLRDAVSHKTAIFFVLEDKKVVGYVVGFVNPFDKKDCMLQETHVDISSRGNGYGDALVKAFCAEAKRRGVKRITAYVEDSTIKFYNRHGFNKSKFQWIEVAKEL